MTLMRACLSPELRTVMVAVLTFASLFAATAQRTTRRGLKERQTGTTIEKTTSPDTLRLPGDAVLVSGYEKPLSSRNESFHVTNYGDYDIIQLIAEITYTDYQGKELHKREVALGTPIPAGSTRMLTFRSWDSQKRFYYSKGPAPRTQAYPYDVAILIKEIIIEYP